MHQKLLRHVGLLASFILTAGILLGGCVEEPTIPVIEKMTTTVRFINGVANDTTYDLYIDNVLVKAGFAFKAVLPYQGVNSGSRNVKLVPTGMTPDKASFSADITFRSLSKLTLVFAQSTSGIGFVSTQERLVYSDERAKLGDSLADVKVINMYAGTAEVMLADVNQANQPLISNVRFGSLSAYTKLKNGARRFTVLTQADKVTVVEAFDFDLQKADGKGYRYTFLLTGKQGAPELLKLQDDPF